MPKPQKVTAIEVSWKRRPKGAAKLSCKSIIFPTEDQASVETVLAVLGFGVPDYSLRFVRVKIKPDVASDKTALIKDTKKAHSRAQRLIDKLDSHAKPAKAQRDRFPGADKKNICHC